MATRRNKKKRRRGRTQMGGKWGRHAEQSCGVISKHLNKSLGLEKLPSGMRCSNVSTSNKGLLTPGQFCNKIVYKNPEYSSVKHGLNSEQWYYCRGPRGRGLLGDNNCRDKTSYDRWGNPYELGICNNNNEVIEASKHMNDYHPILPPKENWRNWLGRKNLGASAATHQAPSSSAPGTQQHQAPSSPAPGTQQHQAPSSTSTSTSTIWYFFNCI